MFFFRSSSKTIKGLMPRVHPMTSERQSDLGDKIASAYASRIKHTTIDLDNTLLHTEDDFNTAIDRVKEHYGIDLPASPNGLSHREWVSTLHETIAQTTTKPPTQGDINHQLHYIYHQLLSDAPPDVNAELLSTIEVQHRDNHHLSLVTNSSEETVIFLSKRYPFLHLFDTIIADPIQGPKPSSIAYQLAIKAGPNHSKLIGFEDSYPGACSFLKATADTPSHLTLITGKDSDPDLYCTLRREFPTAAIDTRPAIWTPIEHLDRHNSIRRTNR